MAFKSANDLANSLINDSKSSITLEREFEPNEFNPNAINQDDEKDRAKLVNYYLTDVWGYEPEEIKKFSDDEINENAQLLLNNINLTDLRKKWNVDEIANHIKNLRRA